MCCEQVSAEAATLYPTIGITGTGTSSWVTSSISPQVQLGLGLVRIRFG